jgi:hypothetical protein
MAAASTARRDASAARCDVPSGTQPDGGGPLPSATAMVAALATIAVVAGELLVFFFLRRGFFCWGDEAGCFSVTTSSSSSGGGSKLGLGCGCSSSAVSSPRPAPKRKDLNEEKIISLNIISAVMTQLCLVVVLCLLLLLLVVGTMILRYRTRDAQIYIIRYTSNKSVHPSTSLVLKYLRVLHTYTCWDIQILSLFFIR